VIAGARTVAGSGSASECAPADTEAGRGHRPLVRPDRRSKKGAAPAERQGAAITTLAQRGARRTPITSRRTEGPPLECAYWWTAWVRSRISYYLYRRNPGARSTEFASRVGTSNFAYCIDAAPGVCWSSKVRIEHDDDRARSEEMM